MREATKKAPSMDELRALRDEINQLAAHYGASNVRAFGSVARGEAGPDSDVDLLVSFPDNRTIFDLVGLWLDLKDLLGREVSLVREREGDDAFMQRIRHDVVPL
jgi:predicted nucleotidyltransferase